MTERTDRTALPLAGLRVVELSIAIAAPTCGRMLHHFGAEVIKIESAGNPDVVRLFGSAWLAGGPEDLSRFACDTGPYVNEMMAGKRSLGLDLKSPAGAEAMRRLLATADVFISNYSAPAITALGLDEASLRALRPQLIYAVLPGFGSDPTTPYYDFLAWGPNQAPLVGLDDLTGYADQEPAGVATISPPDYLSGLHATLGVLAALARRDHTGRGEHIEVNQFEATVCLLAPYLLQQQLGGGAPSRDGNRLAWSAPEGVYPGHGDDRWLALSVTSEAAWQATCQVLDLGAELAALDLATRRARHDEIDGHIAAWTATRSPVDAAAELQGAGVAAHPVHDIEGVVTDPQVRDRGWFPVRPSTRFGRDLFMDVPIKLGATPGDTLRAGPIMGEDTDELLAELGYDPAEVDDMVAARAAFRPIEPGRRLHRPYDAFLPTLVPGLDGGDRSSPAGTRSSRAAAVDTTSDDASPEPTNGHARLPGDDGTTGQPLAGLRVVDLTGLSPTQGAALSSAYGTMLLAGLGAEVVVVEPPTGHPLRHLSPRAPDLDGPEAGLWFATFGAAKRSVVVDLGTGGAAGGADRDRLRALLASADVVIEADGPGRWDELALGPRSLADDAPGLVWVAVTPFGLTGPKRGWQGSDLVAWAASGVLYTLGFPDRAPVGPAPAIQLAYHVASMNAAIGALLAVRARTSLYGKGQVVDIAVAEGCQWLAAETGAPVFLDDQVHRARAGNRRPLTSPFGLYPCADGFVSFLVLQPAHWAAMAQWIHDGTGNEAVLEPIFGDLRVRYEAMDAVGLWTEELTLQHPKLELFREGQRRGIPITPVNTIADLRADPHLAASGFWQRQLHPAIGEVSGPGTPLRTEPGTWRWAAAPCLGQHDHDLFGGAPARADGADLVAAAAEPAVTAQR